MSYRKTPWKLEVQWMNQKPEQFTDMISGHFVEGMNKPGGFAFTVPMTERALDVLWGSKVFLDYRGRTRFGGIINGSDIDTGNNIITFQGIDWMGWLNQRVVDFRSANYGASPYALQAVESDEIVDELIRRYTGASGTDSDFNFHNIDHTGTINKWNLLGRKLGEALIEIAAASKTTDDKVGYFISVLGDRSQIRMKPYGWKFYPEGLPLSGLMWSFDKSNMRNIIHLRGGIPAPYPKPAASEYDQLYQSDYWEKDITTNWDYNVTATTGGTGGYINCVADDFAAIGDRSIRIPLNTTGLTRIYVNWVGTNWSQDWSNPFSSGPFTGQTSYNVADVSTLSHIIIRIAGNNIVNSDWAYIVPYLWTTNRTNYIRWYNFLGGSVTWQKNIEDDTHWFEIVMDVQNASDNCVTGFNWQDVDGFELFIEMQDDPQMDLHLDGLTFAFEEVSGTVRDTNSPWEPAAERYENRAYREWAQGKEIADTLLEQLRYPSVEATGNMPWYDPRLEIGDLLYQEVKGKSIPLYVTSLDVKFAGSLVNTTVGLGRPRPTAKDVGTAFGAIMSTKSEAGTGYKLAAPYTASQCYRLCEAQCELACLTSACQTTNQIGMNVADLCLAACQTFRQRDWYGDMMQI